MSDNPALASGRASSSTTIDLDLMRLRANAPLSATPRPFLRWAGSKQRLLPQLLEFLPRSYNTYFEPFLGAGALFFMLQPKTAVLSDVCVPLVDTYTEVAAHMNAVYAELAPMDILDSEVYYKVRAEKPSDPIRRAARFLYLNRAAWNGLYRVNNRGDFNVPYGRPRSGNTVDAANLQACSTLLAQPSVQIDSNDFEHVNDIAKAGDLVYFDPPYVTGHNNNGFIDYNQNLFSWSDQQRLARLAKRLQDRGVHVIVSNAHHEAILDLYSSFRVAEVTRRSTLASDVSARKSVSEAVFY